MPESTHIPGRELLTKQEYAILSTIRLCEQIAETAGPDAARAATAIMSYLRLESGIKEQG